jgi:hypothetical protein
VDKNTSYYRTMYPDLLLPTNLPKHPPSEAKVHFEGIVVGALPHLHHFSTED